MDLQPKMQPNCLQKFILTQGMQHSLKILQLSQVELGELILAEAEQNPLLEIESTPFAKPKNQYETAAASDLIGRFSLDEYLTRQIAQIFDHSQDRIEAEKLVGELNENGFLVSNLTEHQKQLLPVLQTLDPPGIFARSCQEGFCIQLTQLGLKKSLAYRLVTLCYEDLLHQRFKKIEKQLLCSPKELTEAIRVLSRLSTRPAEAFVPVLCQHIYPDFQVTFVDEKWKIQPLEEAMPIFRINSKYMQIKGSSKEQRELLNGFKSSANWLQQSIERRRQLLFQITAQLVKSQSAYLLGEGDLISICPAELALFFGVHESTISRALADKYIDCPLGIIPLKSLLSTHGMDPTKQLLLRLIHQENKSIPLNDEQLAVLLRKLGHRVARRTVAKYRKQNKIGSAKARKHQIDLALSDK